MSYDIKAACTAAKKRLTRQLNAAVKEQKEAIAADFQQARAPAFCHVAGEQQHRLTLVQRGRVMFEACAASDCDPHTGECLGHCMAVME